MPEVKTYPPLVVDGVSLVETLPLQRSIFDALQEVDRQAARCYDVLYHPQTPDQDKIWAARYLVVLLLEHIARREILPSLKGTEA